MPEPAPVTAPRILVVDDHADTLTMMARLLGRKGFAVESADTIAAAKAKAAAVEGDYDLVITDLGLPDGNGADLMRHLRQSYGLRGIALTGRETDDLAAVGATPDAGFVRHIVKPIDFAKLESAIREALAG